MSAENKQEDDDDSSGVPALTKEEEIALSRARMAEQEFRMSQQRAAEQQAEQEFRMAQQRPRNSNHKKENNKN